jgi:hypothetical protein
VFGVGYASLYRSLKADKLEVVISLKCKGLLLLMVVKVLICC